ncbi:MAG TPA: LacI family DNA-binding transcriptional regulator [Ktedonobacteraceae bacterium]
MSKQNLSIVDVAERAGVSLATASRVMSNSSYPVNVATRQKVLDAAAALGYTPNSLARSLRAQRSKLIAVLVGDNVDPYFAEITRGVEEVANEQGYLTIICNTDRNPIKELHYLRTLRDYRADGIIFAGSGLNNAEHAEQIEKIVAEMRGRGAAVITLSQHTLRVPSIQADNYGGGHDITTMLLEMGHRRIAFVAGPANLTVANVRMQGYMAALVEKGVAIDPNLIQIGNFDQASGERAAQNIAQMKPMQRPTAIFAANDEMAFGVMLELRQQGLQVPQDISVCGFGDIPMSRFVTPALTTVHIPLRQLGRNGANRLLAILRQEEPPSSEIIPITIVQRASTMPHTEETETRRA